MRSFLHLVTAHILLAFLVHASQSYDAFDLIEVVINGNRKIPINFRNQRFHIAEVSGDAIKVESAYIEPVQENGYVSPVLTGDVACFFYRPSGRRRNKLVSPLFRFNSRTRENDILQFSSQDPFFASYVSCFYSSSYWFLPRRRDDVLVLLDYGWDFLRPKPRLVWLKKGPNAINGWRIWDERGKRNFVGRPLYRSPNAIQRFVNDRFRKTFGEPKTIHKAVMVWPERNSITCFLVKSDEQLLPQPFTAQYPAMGQTEDVVGVYCEEYEG